MAGIAIANVVAITGTAFARNADGELRELSPGDVLLEGETLITPEGSQVELQMTDGTPLLVADLPEMAISADLLVSTAPTATESAIEGDTVESIAQALEGDGDLDSLLEDTAGLSADAAAVLQALEDGEDILEGQEETAAGLGGGGQGEGHDFVLLDRIEEGTPDVGGLGDTGAAGDVSGEEEGFNNNPPVVEPVSLGNIDEDTSLVITQADLLAGASDPDGDELAAVNVSVSSGNGTVTDNGDGTFTFVPTEDFNGDVSFDFQVTDGFATVDSSAALVVNPVDDNEAPETTPVALDATGEDTDVTFDEADLLAGSTDPDGDELSVVDLEVTNGGGSLIDNGDGTFTFSPDPDASGDIGLSFGVTDGTETTTNTGSFTVNPVQDAFDDAVSAEEDTAVVVSVLDNDTFEPGAEVTSITQPANGSAELNEDGTVTYTPNPDFSGDDSFTYTVTTVAGDTETATASVVVEGVDDIAGDDATTDEDTAAVIDVMANDDFQEGAEISSVSQGENGGSVTLNEDGTITYAPAPDYSGPDSFTYTVTNANGDEETATVTFTVNPVVDVAPDAAETDEDTPVDIDVMANDSFEPGATVTGVTQGTHGAVTINENGSVNYTPNPDYNGEDSFSYTVTTVAGDTETTTVSVVVNPVEDAIDDDESSSNPVADEDVSVVIDVLDNDTFTDNPVIIDVTQPDNGTVTINPDNTVTFTPDADFNGVVEFDYTVQTDDGDIETASVVVPVNPVDDVLDDAGETEEGIPVVVDVLANDNFESDAVVTDVTNGNNGAVAINPDGTVTYTPDEGFVGFDTFDYTATTEAGNIETATVTVNVTSAGDLANDATATDEDTSVDVDVLANDTVAEGSTLTSITQPANGSASINADGTVNYTPNPDFNGFDTFSYTITTPAGNTESASVGITVNPVVDIVEDSINTDEDTAATINVLDNDNFESDAEVTAVTQGANGSVAFDANGNVTYTPNPDFSGSDSFSYTATTEAGDTETTTVDVTVNAVVDIADDAIVTDEDVAGSTNVLANDSFEAGASVTGVTQASNGVVTFDAAGDVVYTPNADFNGADSFTYTVTTAAGDTETATVNVTVNQVEDIEADAATTDEDTAVNVNVLANDDFASAASVTAVTQGADGVVSINANGTINYAPGPDFNGSDSFTYTATNGAGDEETTTVDITVNQVEDIADDAAVTNEDTAVAVDVLANDGFEPGAEVSGVTQGANGSVSVNPDGTVTYTPNPEFNGQDTFEYTATNVAGDQETATVTVTVSPVNDGPVAVDDANSTSEDVPVSSSLSLLNNDFDIDGDVLSVDAGSVGTFATTQGGSITVDAAGDYTYTPPANFSGSDTFDYTVTDGALTDVGTLTISISDTNDDPIAFNDAGSGVEGGTISVLNGGAVSLLANDSDPEGDPLTVIDFTQPNNGTLTVNADGTFLYEHNGGETTGDSFQYTVSDGQGGEDTATVFLTIAPVNDPPVAVNDAIVVAEDTPVSSGTLSVLDNDTDVDGGPLSVAASSVGTFATAAGGTISMAANGTFSYTPPLNYNGPDSFNYNMTDGQAQDSATLLITVTPVNDPPVAGNDSSGLAEGGSVTFSLVGNDSDVDGTLDLSSITIVSQPSDGTVTVNGNGTVTYTHTGEVPAGQETLADSFTYTIQDNEGATSNVANVSILVDASNEPPVAENVSGSGDEDAAGIAVTLEASDTDGQVIDYTIDSLPANGTLYDGTTELSVGDTVTNTTLTFVPDADWNGDTSFLYHATDDDDADSSIATATITVNPVNDPPVADDDSETTDEDTPVTISVLGNDSDIDGDDLSVTSASDPANGSVTINSDGTITYTPDADFNGTDSFTYVVSDGNGGSDSATVTVDVNPVNDPPVADDDSETTDEDTPVTISVLGNDSDIDGDDLSVTSASDPANGSVTINSDGTITYTPDADFNGTDSFTYVVSDGNGGSDSATVTVDVNPVNDPPVADDDSETTDEDTPVTISVLGNDSDIDGDDLSVTSASDPANGSVTINSDGTITYTPDADFNGTDSFTYVVSDGNGGSDSATVTVDVNPVNDPPVADDDSETTDEDTPVTISVLGNDSDIDGDDLSVTSASDPANGSVTINSDGTITYTPDADFNGTDSFTYVVSDGNGGSDSATVTVDVNPVNDPPVADDDSETTDEDTPVTISVLGNDSDIDGDDLSVTSASDPANGSVTINSDGTITYTPDADFNGTDSFTYVVSDGNGGSDSATVTVDVNPVNDPPVADDDSETTDEDTPVTISVLGNDSDIDGDDLSVTSASDPANGSVTINSDGTITYTPDADFNGTDSFTYVVSDGNGGSDSATVTVDVNPVNDPPVAEDDSFSTNEDTEVSGNVITHDDGDGTVDTDGGDGGSLSVTLGTGPTNGDLTLNSDGSFSYTPDAGYEGSDSFTYVLSDGTDTDTATVSINIGADSTPTLSVTDGEVDEKGLPEGTAPAPALLTDSGTFTIDTSGDSLAVLSVTGKDGAVDVTNGGTVYGDYGTLVVSVSGGAYTWDYTLTDNTLDHPDNPDTGTSEGISDDFTVTVEDSDGDVTPAETLSVSVLDDGPVDEAADQTVDNETGVYSGNLFDPGADGANIDDLVLEFVGSPTWAESLLSLTRNEDGTFTGSTADHGDVFTISVGISDVDGHVDYHFSLEKELQDIERFDFTGNPTGGNPAYTWLTDTGFATGDLEDAPASFITQISSNSTVNTNTHGMGSGSGLTIEGSSGDFLLFDFDADGAGGPVKSVKLGVGSGANGNTGYAIYLITVNYVDGSSMPYTGTVNSVTEFTFEENGSGSLIESIHVTQTDASKSKGVIVTNATIATNEPPEDHPITFEFTTGAGAEDQDGDEVTGEFTITVSETPPAAPPAPAPAPAEEEANIVDATDGTDTLLGTDGDDVFAWSLADNSAEGDTIVDFGDGDAIDLRDLLVGEDAEGGNLSEYLNITSDGTDTVIEVSSGGGFAGGYDSSAVDQIITVEGVDLTSGADQDAIIQGLLDAGKLITD